jgi:hypothetical protein
MATSSSFGTERGLQAATEIRTALGNHGNRMRPVLKNKTILESRSFFFRQSSSDLRDEASHYPNNSIIGRDGRRAGIRSATVPALKKNVEWPPPRVAAGEVRRRN